MDSIIQQPSPEPTSFISQWWLPLLLTLVALIAFYKRRYILLKVRNFLNKRPSIASWPARKYKQFLALRTLLLLISYSILSLFQLKPLPINKIELYTLFGVCIACFVLVHFVLEVWERDSEIAPGERALIKGALTLIAASNQVVIAKLERFREFHKTPGQDIFLAITKPDIQIKLILTQLNLVLKEACGSRREFKLIMAYFEAGENNLRVMTRQVATAPHITDTPSLRPEDWPDSFLAYVANDPDGIGDGGAVVLPDISKEIADAELENRKSRYKKVKGGKNRGSVVGIPIKVRGAVIGVVTIKSDDTIISDQFYDRYELMIKFFMERIALEASLLCIRLEHERDLAHHKEVLDGKQVEGVAGTEGEQ